MAWIVQDHKKMMDGYVVVVFFDDDVSDHHHAAGMIAVSPALHTTTTGYARWWICFSVLVEGEKKKKVSLSIYIII